ncbi:MAG: arsenate reductase ArsC [Syntrophobacteraceae bacterium]
MKKRRVLFICVHNAARSQMAEAFLNGLGAGIFEAHSAGLEPTGVHPLVVDAMKELGYDLSGYKAKSVFELYKQGMLFEYAVTVCRESIESKCPIFPGITARLHWGFDDPVALAGSYGERLEGTRRIRDKIKSRIESWIREITEQEKKGQ